MNRSTHHFYTMSSETDKLKETLTKNRTERKLSKSDFVSTGSALLNKACTGRIFGGFARSHYVFFVGDSMSGKTWLTLTCMAEASINPAFDNFDFYHDNVEDGALMDIESYFGARLMERIQPPARDKAGKAVNSTTVESFYYHLDNANKKAKAEGRPFIYVLDSQDALTSESSAEKFEEQKIAFEKGNESAGSYGDGKAKYHSEQIRNALVGVRDTGSILIIIGQTRDNLGFGLDKKTRSGGRSLRFYATLEMWSSVKGKIERTVNGKKRSIGNLLQIEIRKNRFTGKRRTVEIPIYYNSGIDDVGSCIAYLVEEKHWTQNKQGIVDAPEFDYNGRAEDLVVKIQEEGLERDLHNIVDEVWEEIEAACAVQRKNKYQPEPEQ